jgi:hypothetical protein
MSSGKSGSLRLRMKRMRDNMKETGGMNIHIICCEEGQSSKQWSPTASARLEGSKMRLSGQLQRLRACKGMH